MTVHEVPGHRKYTVQQINLLLIYIFVLLIFLGETKPNCWFKYRLIRHKYPWKYFLNISKTPSENMHGGVNFFPKSLREPFLFFLGKNPGFVLKCSTMHNLNRITSHHPRITGITIYWQCTPAQTFSRRFFQMSWTAKYDQKTITNGLCRIDFPWKDILKIDNLTKRGWCCVGSFTTGF